MFDNLLGNLQKQQEELQQKLLKLLWKQMPEMAPYW